MKQLEAGVRANLQGWFGTEVERWRLLAGYPIRYALPQQLGAQWEAPVIDRNGILLCGDATQTASIQGALVSGRKVAEKLLQQ
jgi:predicted NAD/FAD-dependent oxidoreductase